MEAPKQIVFFSEAPEAMNYKIAKMFKEKGYKTILLAVTEENQLDKRFYQKAYDEIVCTNFQFRKKFILSPKYFMKRIPSLIKFFSYSKKINPYVVIGTSNTNWTIKFARKYFFKKYPFIYFPYDINALRFKDRESALKKKKKFDLEAEKYCFENSDGILTKGSMMELDLLNQTYLGQVKLPDKKISFLPYCSDEFITPLNKNKISRKDKKIHLVSVGGLGWKDSSDLRFLRKLINGLVSQDIHIHFYIRSNNLTKEEQKKSLNEIFENFLESKNLHIHEPLGPKEIIKEISKYDYGLWPGQFRDGKILKAYSHSTGNRLSTFLEAGLPFFYNPDLVLVNEIMKNYGLDLHQADMPELNNLKSFKANVKRLDYKKIEKKVLKAREDFNMKTHFERLEKFINEVVEEKNKRS